MRAFEQALCGMVAQAEVERYLGEEIKIIKEGKEPAYEMTTKFLDYCARKFKGCATNYAQQKGITLVDAHSLVKNADSD